jgi:hypothetical protein
LLHFLAGEQIKVNDLERRLNEIERRSSVEERFRELELRLDTRQQARDEAKRGKPGGRGPKGDKGDKGDLGLPGACGPKGDPGRDAPWIAVWKIDRENYMALPLLNDGTRGAQLSLRELFEQYALDTASSRVV